MDSLSCFSLVSSFRGALQTAGAFSGALIIDQAEVFNFDTLKKLPETSVPVQPTAQPTPVVVQPPVVNPPVGEQPNSVVTGFGDTPEGNRWICRCSWTDPTTLFINPQFRFHLNVFDKANPTQAIFTQTYFPGQEEAFNSDVKKYENPPYNMHKVNTVIYQDTSFGDPKKIFQPGLAMYTMNNQ
ncbi:hypothetical protein HY772_10600 [Candidatus Woesearchaeota archaeon]|nr:hypothetical protein [Candidatus Woesearchaeota archaeon]